LSALNSGSLLASFGTHLTRQLSKSGSFTEEQQDTFREIKEFAYGKTQQVWVPPEDEDYIPDASDFYEEEEPSEGVDKHRWLDCATPSPSSFPGAVL
jgi:hypothetical protein